MSGNINFNGWLNDDGSENYKCRAWVNFNGTGTVAIRASGNVYSITDNGTGNYTVNLTTAMPDASYAAATQANSSNVGSSWGYLNSERYRTSSLYQFMCSNTSYTVQDCENATVAIFR